MFDFGGKSVVFKIDRYDRDLSLYSSDSADPDFGNHDVITMTKVFFSTLCASPFIVIECTFQSLVGKLVLLTMAFQLRW